MSEPDKRRQVGDFSSRTSRLPGDSTIGAAIVDRALAAKEGACLADDLYHYVKRFVAFPSEEAAVAVTLWAIHAHALDAAESTPRLAVLSTEKGSGKTRTLEVLETVVPTPRHAVNMTAAALFRAVTADRPTLLFDESDTYFGPHAARDHEELRGLVNAGHRRGAVAYRVVGKGTELNVQAFPAFAAVAVAGIGDLPDTILDRAVLVRMRRRAPYEHVEPFRARKVRPIGDGLRDRLAAWAAIHMDELTASDPDLPKGLIDRPADVWEPLIAIADALGGSWPGRARHAAVKLNSERQAADPSLGVRLLADAHSIFSVDRLSTDDLVGRLVGIEESPWGDLRGKPLDARGLARRLRPYEIGPKKIRIGADSLRGYERSDFVDAWARYLPSPKWTEQVEHAEQGDVAPAGDDDVPEHDQESEQISLALTCDVPPVPDVPPNPGTIRDASSVPVNTPAMWNGNGTGTCKAESDGPSAAS